MVETNRKCPCGGDDAKAGYSLCETCLEIAGANGIDISVFAA